MQQFLSDDVMRNVTSPGVRRIHIRAWHGRVWYTYNRTEAALVSGAYRNIVFDQRGWEWLGMHWDRMGVKTSLPNAIYQAVNIEHGKTGTCLNSMGCRDDVLTQMPSCPMQILTLQPC